MEKERMPRRKPLPTIWCVPDELWKKIEPILAKHDPPKRTGRPRVDQRAVSHAIIFRLRSCCQWNPVRVKFPDDFAVHRTFQPLGRAGCPRTYLAGLG